MALRTYLRIVPQALCAKACDDRGVYYDDIEVGTSLTVGTYRVEAEEIIDFARRWDPLPVHTSEVDARATSFGGLTASGAHTMAIRTRLTHLVPIQESVIAAAGWDDVRFHRPLRPGDEQIGRAHV